MLNGKIRVAEGFQTSVNIGYDWNNDAKVRGFIPTQSSLDIIEEVLLSTTASASTRARILVGAYGRGKSHIILVLLSLLASKNTNLFELLLKKMEANNPELHAFSLNYLNSGRKLLPVVIRGSSTSLSSSFLSALQLTLSDEGLSDIMPETHFQAALSTIESWKREYPKTYNKLASLLPCIISDFVLRLKEYDSSAYEFFVDIYPKLTSGSAFNPFLGFDIVDLYESVTSSVRARGYDGIFVVYDEFSKYLESSIASASISDIKLLQDFAEKCDRSGERQMHMLLICHKNISNYIDSGLPKEKVDGWRGVSGRFRQLELHNNYAQMYEIISEVIIKDGRFWFPFIKRNKARFNELSYRFTSNKMLDANSSEEIEYAIYGCYPLHPVSTFILPRLSERIAQNERTLFTFLSADEKHTLSAFLSSAGDKFSLLTPDVIYDYFESLLRNDYTSEAHKTYKLTANVLQKVDENSLSAKIIKTIALIYLVEQFEKLPPTIDVITDAFRDNATNVQIISDTLHDLIEKDCVVYQKRSNNFLRLKETSGADIPSEIANYIERNSAVLRAKDILNQSAFDSYIYPTRYNDEHDITRYFDFTFIDSADFFEVADWTKRIASTNADGVVFAVIPQNTSDISKLRTALSHDAPGTERILFVIPNEHYDIGRIAFEYEAVKNLRESAEGDALLVDEYDIHFEDLAEVLGSYINTFARPENGGASYYYGGQRLSVYRRCEYNVVSFGC